MTNKQPEKSPLVTPLFNFSNFINFIGFRKLRKLFSDYSLSLELFNCKPKPNTMKSLFIFFVGLLSCFSAYAQTNGSQSVTDPVIQQLEAYNKRNIEAFASAFSDTVKVYRQPGVLTYQGRDELRKRYGQMFENTPDLHCQLVNRIVSGNVVIDHERVQFSKDQPRREAIAVYRVRNNEIVEVTFISPDNTDR